MTDGVMLFLEDVVLIAAVSLLWLIGGWMSSWMDRDD